MKAPSLRLALWTSIAITVLPTTVLCTTAIAEERWRVADYGDGNADFTLVSESGTTLYSSNGDGDLWRSDDDGETWRWLPDRNFSFTFLFSIRSSPSHSKHVVIPAVRIDGTRFGFMLSLDGGETWQEIEPPDLDTTSIDFGHDGRLFADGQSLYTSEDLGETWQAVDTLPGFETSPTVVPTPTATVIYAQDGGSVYYSSDAGQTFRNVSESLPDVNGGQLFISPADPKRFAHGLIGNELRLSNDGGLSFSEIATPGFIRNIKFHPRQPSRLVMVVDSGQVHTTRDGGVTWSMASVPTLANASEIWFDPCDDDTLYLRTEEENALIRSVDWGQTYDRVGPKEPGRVRQVAAFEEGCNLLAMTSAGPFRITEHGEHWRAVTPGLSGATAWAFAFDPVDPDRMYSYSQGMHASSDQGRSWSRLPNRLSGATISALQSGDGVLWASALGTFHRSLDQGETFEPVHRGLNARDLKMDPFDAARILFEWRSTDGNVYWTLSTDSGLTLGSALRIGEGDDAVPLTHAAFDPYRQGVIYGFAGDTGQFLVSSDGGGTFVPKGTLAADWQTFQQVEIQASPAGRLYAWRRPEAQFWWSEDGGDTWQQSPEILQFIRDFQVDVAQENLLYAISGTAINRPYDPRLWRSVDNGASWFPWNEGLRRGSALVVAQSPVEPALFLSSTNMGISRRKVGEPGPCQAGDPTVLCLHDGRYELEARWATPGGREGLGKWVPETGANSGLFYFFEADNWEVLLKTLDACAINDRWWFFSSATTNVEYTLTVRDRETGKVRRYLNPPGQNARAVTDVFAFDGCP